MGQVCTVGSGKKQMEAVIVSYNHLYDEYQVWLGIDTKVRFHDGTTSWEVANSDFHFQDPQLEQNKVFLEYNGNSVPS